MKTKKSQALERIITLMNESFNAEDIMKIVTAGCLCRNRRR